MVDLIITEKANITVIADAVRHKAGISGDMTLGDIIAGINGIETGGGEVLLQDKTITENGEYTADAGYNGLGKVTVEVAGSGNIEPLKAFVASTPTASEVVTKNIAVVPMEFQYAYKHTNTLSTLSVSFDYGNVGDTLVLAFATRSPSAEPAIPPGWTKIAWISPHENSTSNQWLLVATMTTTTSTAGTTGTVSFDVVVGKRNYLMVINTRDCKIDAASPIISKAGGTHSIETDLFENTLLICTSETATAYGDGYGSWIKVDGGYSADYLPQFDDTRELGGRLAMLYIPFTSQQPFSKLNLKYINHIQPSTSILTCALNVTPGEKSLQYVATM